MGSDTEELKRDIERTRADMSDTLDAIGDRVRPGRIAQRNKNRMMQSVSSVRERIMGVASDAQDKVMAATHDVTDKVGGAADSVHHAPEMVTAKTQGAPMVAGAIAFGVGFLLASAFPASEKEKELSGQVLDKLEPAKEQLMESAHEVADHLKQPVTEAAQQVKEAASESAHEVADTARTATQSTTEQAAESVQSVRSNVS